MKNINLIILIPCYNEKKTIIKILNSIKKKKLKYLVIDNNSNDGTKEILKKNKINYQVNKIKGYESTILYGFKYILKNNPNFDYIITLDADGEHKINEIKLFLKTLNSKPDLVVGNRNRKNRILESVLSALFKIKFNIADPLSGYKAYSKKIIKDFRHYEHNLFLTDIINFNYKKKKLTNIAITSPKRKGLTKQGPSFQTNIKILKILFLALFQ